MKQTIFNNHGNFIHTIPTDPTTVQQEDSDKNCKTLHTIMVQEHISELKPNKILNTIAPEVSRTELSLPRKTRTILAGLRTNKSSFLRADLNHIDNTKYPSPLCPACNTQSHDTAHLFNCPLLPTHLTTRDLWTNPVEVNDLLERWKSFIVQP